MRDTVDKKTKIIFLVILFVALAVVGYYCFLVNRDTKEQKENTVSTVQAVLARDLKHDYPPSPKEVLKYYQQINKCLYNEECTEQEMEDLALKARELFDEELQANNELGRYLIKMTSEVKNFRAFGRRISNISISASTDVDFFEDDGHSFARLRCGYTILEKKQSYSTIEVYLLRKDADDHWKIYGWDLAENVYVD